MICKVFKISWATWYRVQKETPRIHQRRGPKPPLSDEVIEQEIKGVIWDPNLSRLRVQTGMGDPSIRSKFYCRAEENPEDHATARVAVQNASS
jgi:hypothetical protein